MWKQFKIFSDEQISHNRIKNNNYNLIADLLPYRFFDEENKLFINSNSIGFAIEIPPLIGANESTIDTLTGMITDGLPAGCTIQFVNWASPKVDHWFRAWQAPRNQQGGIYQKIAQKRIDHFKQANSQSLFQSAPFTIKDFRLLIIASMPLSSEEGNLTKKLINWLNSYKQDLNLSRLIANISTLRDRLIATLSSIGVSSKILDPQSLINFVSEIINLNADAVLAVNNTPPNVYNPFDPINIQIVDPDNSLKVQPDSLTLWSDNKAKKILIKSLTVKNYPQMWAGWQCRDLIGDFFSDFKRMEQPFLTSFAITVPADESKMHDYANFKSFRSTQALNGDLAKYMPHLKSQAMDWRFVSEKINAGQRLFKTFYQILIFAPENKIHQAEQSIKDIYKSSGWDLTPDKYITLQSFLAALPFHLSEGLYQDLEKIKRTKTMVSWTCANLAPLQAEWRGMNSPCLMLFGRRGQPFFWNPFANKDGNFNVAVVGKSGSGKSVFMQEIVSSVRGFGGKIYIIDDGRSFMNSCLLQGGEFVEFSGQRQICINPFSIIDEKSMLESSEYKGEVLNLIKSMIKQMCRPSGLITDFENGLIEALSNKDRQLKSITNININ